MSSSKQTGSFETEEQRRVREGISGQKIGTTGTQGLSGQGQGLSGQGLSGQSSQGLESGKTGMSATLGE
jgi:hypothetical protein